MRKIKLLITISVFLLIIAVVGAAYKPIFGRNADQIPLSCEDSDGGLDATERGKVTVEVSDGDSVITYKKRDYCSRSGEKVKEFFCVDENLYKKSVKCKYGECSNGECPKDPSCNEGWTCVGNVSTYLNGDCFYTKGEYCAFGCNNGECNTEQSCNTNSIDIRYVEDYNGKIKVEYDTEDSGTSVEVYLVSCDLPDGEFPYLGSMYPEENGCSAEICHVTAGGCGSTPGSTEECNVHTTCDHPEYEENTYFAVAVYDSGCPNVKDNYAICADSDGGPDYEEKGFVYKPATNPSYTSERWDTCKDDNNLYEWYCNNVNTPSRFTKSCSNGCSDGVCEEDEPEPEPETQCTETDDGLDYFVRGTTNGTNAVGTDFCGIRTVPEFSEPEIVESCDPLAWESGYSCKLYEYACGTEGIDPDHAVRWEHDCLYGCEDGACKDGFVYGPVEEE